MDTFSPSGFERCALASGLLTRKELDEARAALRWSDKDQPEPDVPRSGLQLAEKLVEMGRLNPWQAQQLLDGRTKFNLGPYWIVDSIGQGGMGQVFKAEHGVMGRVVAIKVLPRSKCTPEAIASFTREIRALARLDHPNLVRALDAGHDGNVYYLVTEYVAGTDLRKLVRRNGTLSMQAAAGIVSQVAQGLQHAHEQGLIHRDVKPGNVLVTPDGHAKLSDLGLAGPLGGDAQEDPRFGKIVGTADYLSPDHIKFPSDPKPAWDIYSLGCTLYYAVTGKVPFPGGSIADKARAHCELRPLDPRRLNPSLSAEFVDVIAEMMAKDIGERIDSGAEVSVRLAPWTGGLGVPQAPDTQLALLARSTRSLKAEHAEGTPPSQGPHEPGFDDTQSSFPEMPELQPDAKESPSQASQTTHAVGSAADETLSPFHVHGIEPTEPLAILRPLMVFVALPLLMATSVIVIYWLVTLLSR